MINEKKGDFEGQDGEGGKKPRRGID